MKKLMLFSAPLLLSLSLVACSQKDQPAETQPSVQSQQIVAKHSDVRLKFNKVSLGSAAQEFKGGTNLAHLKELFGEPVQHEQVPAGDVTLDAYRWLFDQVEIRVQLFEDSAITRSISYFSFIKEPTIGAKQMEAITAGMTYTQVIDLLGEPDVLSEAISSDKEELQALWTSGLKIKGQEQAQIQLFFENKQLKTINHVGLAE